MSALRIERELVPTSTLEAFALQHGLTMQVFERGANLVAMSHIGEGARFFAHFRRADVKDRTCLVGVFGDGPTEELAIEAYGREISEKLLVIDSGTPQRREIQVPRILSAPSRVKPITAAECYELGGKKWMPAAASEALVRAARTIEALQGARS